MAENRPRIERIEIRYYLSDGTYTTVTHMGSPPFTNTSDPYLCDAEDKLLGHSTGYAAGLRETPNA